MKADDIFDEEKRAQIEDAIALAEKDTSGEIRVHIEDHCNEEILDHAAFIFKTLEMEKTAARNGVLIYLAVLDKKFAIIGDSGINAKVPDGFWDSTRDIMTTRFRNNELVEGIVEGVRHAGQQLKQHFPYQQDDINELSNEVSFGNLKDND